jgi:vesicle coat complex subunit
MLNSSALCPLPPLQDSQDPNPLIRALAVRTMGCIRVDKITEYLCDPLHRCLKVGRPRAYTGGQRR